MSWLEWLGAASFGFSLGIAVSVPIVVWWTNRVKGQDRNWEMKRREMDLKEKAIELGGAVTEPTGLRIYTNPKTYEEQSNDARQDPTTAS